MATIMQGLGIITSSGISSNGYTFMFYSSDFVFWHLPQIQYKNPEVQVVTFKNMTPSPFVRCYFDDGKQMLIDVDSRTREEIMEHLIKVVGKSK